MMDFSGLNIQERFIERSRYDYTLAEFPFCLFSSKFKTQTGEDGEEYYEYKDRITGKDKKPVERTWRIHKDPEAGFGGRSTLGTIFEIFQLWKEQSFESRNIRFGTVNNLLRRKGVKSNRDGYRTVTKDLLFMAGAQYDAINAFWDNDKKAYVTVKRFKFFDFLAQYDKTPKHGQEQLPFGFIRASEILHNAVLSGTLSLDFDRGKFHKLTPLEQRLALYGSKVVRTQRFIKRDLVNFTRQMTITTKSIRKVRQQFRRAVDSMKAKGVYIFSRVEFEKSADRKRENIILHVSSNLPLPFKQRKPSGKPPKPEHEFECLVEDILEVCKDENSKNFYKKVAGLMDRNSIYKALGEVKETQNLGEIKKSAGALFTNIIKKSARDQSIEL